MIDSQELETILDTAIDIAERASEIALSHFRHAILIEMKENMTPVTIADKKTEEMIRHELQREFPGHGILGEEFGSTSSQSKLTWTIDPIDGTRSFIRGIPLFGTLLGLMDGDDPILGVMVLPALRETYYAARDLGAHCGSHQLHVSNTADLSSAMISIGDTSCFRSEQKQHILEGLQSNADVTRGYTDCFGHALVLRGGLDAMVDPLVSIWDIAPIACLVREAGGDYMAFNGERTVREKSFVTYTPALRESLLQIF